MTNEEYVRARWDSDAIRSWCYINNRPFWLCVGDDFCTGPHANETEAWQAARSYTDVREVQKRLIEDEIGITRVDLGFAQTEYTQAVYSRILARAQSELAELKKGMKQ